jgi:hypothetical protein
MSAKVVFWTVVFLTVLCGGAAGILAFACGTETSPSLAQYQKALLHVFVAGALAIFGLLGSAGLR